MPKSLAACRTDVYSPYSAVSSAFPRAMFAALARPPVRKAIYGTAVPLVVIAAVVSYSFDNLFTTFRLFDDTGYYQLTAAALRSKHILYDQVFSYYGPAYHLVLEAVYDALRTPVNGDTAGFITIAAVAAIALIVYVLVLQTTNRVWLAASAALAAGYFSQSLTSIPLQPAIIYLPCLVGLPLAFVQPRHTSSRRLGFLAAGGLCAITGLCKINLGATTAIMLGLAVGATGPNTVLLSRRRLVTLSVAIAFPFASEFQLISQPWASQLAGTVALSSAAVIVWAAPSRPPLPRSTAIWLTAGALFTSIIFLAVVLLQRTTLHALVQSLLVEPLQQAHGFNLPVQTSQLSLLAVPLAIVGFVAAIRPRPYSEELLAIIRVVAGGSFFLVLILLNDSDATLLGAATAWLLVAFPADQPMPAWRPVLALSGVIALLTIYPVAGAQAEFPRVVLVPVAAVIVNDGLNQWAEVARTRARPARSLPFPIMAFIALVGTAPPITLLSLGTHLQSAYASGYPLRLPGMASYRLPAFWVDAMQSTTAELKHRCTSFISDPGLDSFYFWANMKPPTTYNDSGWMVVFPAQLQRTIISQISHERRLCLLKSPAIIEFWLGSRHYPFGPLETYLDTHFHLAGKYWIYEVLTRGPLAS